MVAPDVVTVTTVVDGDTFGVSDGRTVRVPGIDSCEAGTDAGRDATASATSYLPGKPVTLPAEPGADKDPYGRVLRYARMPDGEDFGKVMAPATHTGVYERGGAVPDLRPAGAATGARLDVATGRGAERR